ncbi:hypothetical protein [Glutamicibacter creatinolyticus]|uniref:hypothetical protein n=1 Tax=Glutamicibacter creatinolyticus TaxID=162496 RepID=UPI0032163694
MRATCEKFKDLRVSFDGGSIKFKGGVAEVTEAQAARLVRLPESYGVKVEQATNPSEDAGGGKGSDKPFDPSEHNAADVLAYLDGLPDEDPDARGAEVHRVLEAEKAGKGRKGVIEAVEGTPE